MPSSNAISTQTPPSKEYAVRGKLLNPMVARIRHINIPIWVRRCTPGIIKLAISVARTSYCSSTWIMPSSITKIITSKPSEKSAVRVKLLDSMIERVNHIDKSIWVNSHTIGKPKLSVSSAKTSELHEKATIWVKLLDPMVWRVRHVNIIIRINTYAPGRPELAISRAIISFCSTPWIMPSSNAISTQTPPSKKYAVRGKLLNPMVIRIRHIDITIGVNSYISVPIKLAISRTITSPFKLKHIYPSAPWRSRHSLRKGEQQNG